MRRLKTYPALLSVLLPRSAVILAVHPAANIDFAPVLLVSCEAIDDEKVERRFKVLRSLDTIPPGAQFVHSWRQHPADGGIAALFELAEEMPAGLPPEMHEHYRLLLREGFTPAHVMPGALHAWKAPDDIPAGQLSNAQLIAVASLQEYGFGSVVNA